MAVVYDTKVSENFLSDLRDRYGSINNIQVVPLDFPTGLDKLLLNTHIILEHHPNEPLATARMKAIRDYIEELRRLNTTQYQQQSSYPSR